MPPPRRLASLPFPPFGDDRRSGGGCRTWLVPAGLAAWHGGDGASVRLAAGPLGFTHIDVLQDRGGEMTVARIGAAGLLEESAAGGSDAEALAGLALDRLVRERGGFAGLPMDRWHIMGIVNATPDSFSDGGDNLDPEAAVRAGLAMREAGAAVVDVGGESTRPGAEPVERGEEERRILPVVEGLAGAGCLVSADTRHTQVMASALDAGASIVNDVGGLGDEGAAELVASRGCSAVVMHMQGEPGTMHDNPEYRHAPTDVFDWLEERIESLRLEGVEPGALAVDPGFGFGKTPEHNMQIMASLALFHGLGVPVLIGASRKRSIAHYSRGEEPKDRVHGSTALAAVALGQGVQMFRVHDVAETRQAIVLAEAVNRSGS